MKDIAIYGAGGFGRETSLLIQQINAHSQQWNLIGFYDDGIKPGTRVGNWPVLGGMVDLPKTAKPSMVVAVSDPLVRQSVVERLSINKYDFPSLIHPTCQTGVDNQIGKGCVLTAGVILTIGIKIHDFVIINLQSTVGHDVVLGSFSAIMPGCSISGNVKIGACTMMGTGARILQNITIGDHCRIGAGAVVTQDFSDHKTLVGVPAYEK